MDCAGHSLHGILTPSEELGVHCTVHKVSAALGPSCKGSRASRSLAGVGASCKAGNERYMNGFLVCMGRSCPPCCSLRSALCAPPFTHSQHLHLHSLTTPANLQLRSLASQPAIQDLHRGNCRRMIHAYISHTKSGSRCLVPR